MGVKTLRTGVTQGKLFSKSGACSNETFCNNGNLSLVIPQMKAHKRCTILVKQRVKSAQPFGKICKNAFDL